MRSEGSGSEGDRENTGGTEWESEKKGRMKQEEDKRVAHYTQEQIDPPKRRDDSE